MKIVKPHPEFGNSQQARQDLLRLISQPTAAEAPPCPGCQPHSSAACSCRCDHAPQRLSIDGINYPLETNVVPLVFELATIRLLQPCWSCEGHMSPEGELWKIPQVCFYAASPFYPQLLLRHISALELQKRLTYPWRIALADFGQTWDVTYTLEPNLNYDQRRNVHLSHLQNDLNTLAENLGAKLKALAQAMLEELPVGPSSSP